MMRNDENPIDRLEVRSYTVPTDGSESDATLEWDTNTCVVVAVYSGGAMGLGYTYSNAATAELIDSTLKRVVCGADAMSPEACWRAMLGAVRNLGRQGIAAHAVSAVDIALWDLKARLLDVSLVRLWGGVRARVPAYGSGGFTSYDDDRLREQLTRWRNTGLKMAKIKVGRHRDRDMQRVELARSVLGDGPELFVDADGAYELKEALSFADAFADAGVTWMEEPLSSTDVEGLRTLRSRVPGHLRIAAGEYAYHPFEMRHLLEAGAVDVLQADVTRCLGFTGFIKTAALCEAWSIPLSSHGAPALSAHLGASLTPFLHAELFHDHVRIEERLLRGVPPLVDGCLVPDASAKGHGLSIVPRMAYRYAA